MNTDTSIINKTQLVWCLTAVCVQEPRCRLAARYARLFPESGERPPALPSFPDPGLPEGRTGRGGTEQNSELRRTEAAHRRSVTGTVTDHRPARL